MADGLIFQTEKQIKEFSDKLTDEDKKSLQSDLDELKSAHSSKDLDKIDESSKKLNDTWAAISTRLYQQSSQDSSNNNTDSGDGSVEDTSYEEVK